MPHPSARPAGKKVKASAQRGRKPKRDEEETVQKTQDQTMNTTTKSLEEMKTFINKMQLKYNSQRNFIGNDGGGDLPATATKIVADTCCFQSFSDKILRKYSNPNRVSHASEFAKYVDLAETAAFLSPSATVNGKQQQQEQGEKQHVEDSTTRYITTNVCNCSCSEVAEEAASLKVLVAELRRGKNSFLDLSVIVYLVSF
jgi:hypothetical protein